MKRNGVSFPEVLAFLVLAMAVMVGIVIPVLYSWSPGFRATWNRQQHRVQKADDATRYETLRTVEDTCRAMQASYQADVSAYRAYADAGDTELATQMLIRINRTACTYNEYVRKNSYVWRGQVPKDIDAPLVIVTK